MKNTDIDGGKEFDWGRTSFIYAKYRDIYPEAFYKRMTDRGLCVKGQRVLDLGTGTGVLPRNMYKYGAQWTCVDISPRQIEMAEKLAKEGGMDITFKACAAEDINYAENSFDVVTACQCFWYFDQSRLIPALHDIIKENGRLLILYMAWLPYEDKIAGESEKLVLKYSPQWTGKGERIHPIGVSDITYRYFEKVYSEEYTLDVPFTRESWHGRMKACRGIGASLTEKEIALWEKEHIELLKRIAPEKFAVKHYAAMLELTPKNHPQF